MDEMDHDEEEPDDLDKVLYNKVGELEVTLDKIFCNLLTKERY